MQIKTIIISSLVAFIIGGYSSFFVIAKFKKAQKLECNCDCPPTVVFKSLETEKLKLSKKSSFVLNQTFENVIFLIDSKDSVTQRAFDFKK